MRTWVLKEIPPFILETIEICRSIFSIFRFELFPALHQFFDTRSTSAAIVHTRMVGHAPRRRFPTFELRGAVGDEHAASRAAAG